MRYMLLLYRTGDALPAHGHSRVRPDRTRSTAPPSRPWAGPGSSSTALRWERRGPLITVRVRDGETIITDGPSAEIKEQLGGYTIIECADLTRRVSGRPPFPRPGRLGGGPPDRGRCKRPVLSSASISSSAGTGGRRRRPCPPDRRPRGGRGCGAGRVRGSRWSGGPAAGSRPTPWAGSSAWPGTRPWTDCGGRPVRRVKEAAAAGTRRVRPGQDTSPRADDTLSLVFFVLPPGAGRLGPRRADAAVGVRAVRPRRSRARSWSPRRPWPSAWSGPRPRSARRASRSACRARPSSWAAGGVLRVIYVLFTEGHMATTGDALVRGGCATPPSRWPVAWPA